MKVKAFRIITILALCLTLLPAALAAEDHICAEGEWEDHLCDECGDFLNNLCTDADGDHYCDLCWHPVTDACADVDGDEYCDVCWSHMIQHCIDTDNNHSCDVCWRVLSTCSDENKNHLCDICGSVFWADENGDGVCDGCDAVLTHVTAEHKGVYYHTKNGATVVDVAIEVTVQPYVEFGGTPAGTVSIRWIDENGKSYSSVEKALTFGATTVTVEHPSLPIETLKKGGRVIFTPYDAGFTPAENGCVIEYDLPQLRINSDSEYTVNGVAEGILYLPPGTKVTVVQQPGPTPNWEWVFEDGYAVPEVTTDGLTSTFLMPEENVNMHAAWRCEVCTDADNDNWCDVCEYYMEDPTHADDTEPVDVWYHEAVNYVLEHELMDAVDADSFSPNEAADRAAFVQALWKAAGAPVVNYLMTFSDVDQDAPYVEAVRWAASEGIATGFPDGTFRPGQTITRQEMATFLYRYEQKQGGGFVGAWMFLLDCTDRADVAEWAYEPMCWLNMNGILNGDGTGALNPKKTATRAEAAQMLMNYLNYNNV